MLGGLPGESGPLLLLPSVLGPPTVIVAGPLVPVRIWNENDLKFCECLKEYKQESLYR